MFGELDQGVIVTNGRSGVWLRRAGLESELGHPTLIKVQVGSFSGTVRDDTVGSYAEFRQQLIRLYNELSGTARLGSYEGFGLEFMGNGLGTISISVKIETEPPDLIRFTFSFEIDQTYLPGIIHHIAAEFPTA